MKHFKKIKGERVYLSPYNPEDFELLTKWLNDPAVTDGLGDSYLQCNLKSEKKWLDDALEKGEPSFAIVLNEGDRLIGSVGLMDVKLACGSAMVGIFIGETEDRGKGYGAEAMRLMLGYSFDVLNLYNIMLNVYEFNVGAYKAYLKAGFKEFGRRRGAYYLNNKRHDIISMDITRGDYYETLESFD